MLIHAIVGHLIADYLMQNDWMASNKKKAWPGKQPHPELIEKLDRDPTEEELRKIRENRAWKLARTDYYIGIAACSVHCLQWALVVMAAANWWRWEVAIALFLSHYVQDRTNIIAAWMDWNGQEEFRTGPCAPWSGIVVDNVWHIVALYAIERWIIL